MKFSAVIARARNVTSSNRVFRNQLLWLLTFRIVLYTLLLAINSIFKNSSFNIIFVPSNILIIFLLVIYLSTSFSAFYLLVFNVNLRKFGFAQCLLDTCFASLIVFFSGSSSSIFTSVFFFPIVAGGLILPKKGGVVAAAAATLQYGTLLFLESHGLYPLYFLKEYLFLPATTPIAVLNNFSVHGLTFFLVALFSTLFGIRLQKTESALDASLKKFDRLAVLYKQIFDNISTGIITTDSAGTITSANNAIGKIIAIEPVSLLGKELIEIFPHVKLSSENQRMVTDFTRSDGTTLRIGYSNMAILQPEERRATYRPPPWIITLQDISEIEKLESQVRQTEKLAAIGMMSASIAHDFRNPLTAISGSAQVLAQELAAEGTRNYANFELANIILRESNRLINTVGEFLKFSRPEHANCAWFSLRNCLEEVIQVCKADPVWPNTCHIVLNFKDNLDLWADEKQIFTVFSHCIQNSLAFCPVGSEWISISAEETTTSNAHDAVIITILDNGPGIVENERDQIFEPFYTSRPDGTGLGLAIVKQTITEHGGAITVDNAEKGGALFTLILPLPE